MQWKYCTRSSRIGCKATVDTDGWVRPGKGKRGRGKTRAVAAGGTLDSTASGSEASGRLGELQKDIGYLEAFPVPAGLGVAHVDEQLVALRVQRDAAAAALAADTEAGAQRAVSERDLEAMRGLFVQLRTLPTAHTGGSFARAWEGTMEQLAAVEALFFAPESKAQLQQRERRGDSCPLDGGAVDSDSDADLLEPQPAEERGQAARRGPAAGGWTKVAPGLISSPATEAADLGPLATVTLVAAEAQGRRIL
ncbi:unnamed protein product [Prorocentrum cordatum]|uniref:Uncharacterized protein n=1 Tax=Prorocentrum cordatum TaxID=2364126 RepID=A0ABN9S0D0_9DINO|nr:unnamed protein product [Polarella glacialis]